MKLLFTKLILNFDRSFSGKSRNQIIWLISGIIFTIGLLYATAILLKFQAPSTFKEQQENHLLRYIITLFLDPGTINKSLLANRWYAIITSICGITLFTGVLISVISNMLERRVERYRTGDIRYSLSRHVVIIGFDKATAALITQLCNKHKKAHILIQSTSPTEIIRDKLHEFLNDACEKRIVIFHARRNSQEELELLNTHKALEIFILGEENEYEHDFVNIDCLKQLTEIHCRKKRKSSPIPATVLFNSQTTFAVFQLNDISKRWREHFYFRPINHQHEWAKRVLVERQYTFDDNNLTYPTLDGEGIPYDSNMQVHLVIIGMSKMGIALAIEAAHIMHFPNFCRDKSRKTKITFIDKEASCKAYSFIQQHNHFFEIAPYYFQDFNCGNGEKVFIAPSKQGEMETDFLDIEFTFINGNVESKKIRALIHEWSTDLSQSMSIACCLDDSQANLAIGLHLPDSTYTNKRPIFIQQQTSGTLLNIIRATNTEGKWNKYAHVYPFGMYENNYDVSLQCTYAAQCINFIYEYYNTNQQLPKSITTDEELVKLWYEKPIALQWSNNYSTHSIPQKLRALHINPGNCALLTEEQVDLIAQVEHNRWNIEKLLLGYRKPTEAEVCSYNKNELKIHYTHPDITPYHKLAKESQNYDKAITSGIPLIAKHFVKLQ